MRYHPFGFVTSACLCGALLAACAGGGSSAARPAGILPANANSAGAPAPRGGVRRTLSVPLCSGLGTDAFVGGGVSNVASGHSDGVLAGSTNEVCDSFSSIAGGEQNSISSSANTSDSSFIGAGFQNTITGGAQTGFIGGGSNNALTGGYSAIVSGQYNQNAGTNAMLGAGEANKITSSVIDGVIGGGSNNTLSATYGVIAGGIKNNVSGEGGYIAAGGYNTLSGIGAVIDGGFNNAAAGDYGTIPGGYVNSAGGIYSFAAGARASAAQTGTFVWSDGSDGDTILSSTRAYQFLARASGGYTLWTNAASTVGATLAPGSGTWASASDRNMKTDVVRVDDAAVLDKIASLPINRWSYITERGVRHVGPMAQDFYAAFGVGADDKHITSIDEDGVALAAIKALHARVGVLDAENVSLRAQLAALKTSQARHDLLVDRELQRLSVVSAPPEH
jgi:hypothetical protein